MLTVWDWQKKSKIAEIKVINFVSSMFLQINYAKVGQDKSSYMLNKIWLDAMVLLVLTGAVSDH